MNSPTVRRVALASPSTAPRLPTEAVAGYPIRRRGVYEVTGGPRSRRAAPALLEPTRLPAVRRPVLDPGPPRPRLPGGERRPLPPSVSLRAPVARTVQRESGQRGVTPGESAAFCR